MNQMRHSLADPPKDSDATLIHNDGDVVVSFPPKGVIRGYWRHLVFSVVVALAGVPFFFVTTYPAVVLLWRLLPVCMCASGVYLLGSTIQRGRTRTRITSGGGDLTVEKVGPLFSTRGSWPVSKISAVTLSGFRLVSITVEGKTITLRLDRSRSELRWFVGMVRSILGMPPQSSERPRVPAATKVVWERNGERVKIIVPPERTTLVTVAASFLLLLGMWFLRLFHSRPGDEMSAMLAMLSVLCIGVAAPLVLLRNRLKYRTTFEMTPSELAVARPFLIGRRHQKWNREEIEDVTTNGQTLFVWFKRSSKMRAELLLGGRTEDLRWIAATIRYEMRLLVDDQEPKSAVNFNGPRE